MRVKKLLGMLALDVNAKEIGKIRFKSGFLF